MSIKVMSYVWDGFPGSGSELLAMLAMADWCDDKGGSLYPSMRAVGDKIRVGEKQARRIIQSFEKTGYLSVTGNAHGGAPGATKQFRLNVEKLKHLADQKTATPPAEGSPTPPAHVTPPLHVRGDILGGYPSHPASETPPAHGSQTTIEPSIRTTNINTARALESFVLPDWINQKHWDAWNSCDKRKKVTVAQKQMAVEKLEKWRDEGLDFAGALENAAVAGWQGLFKPEERNKPMAMKATNSETAYQRSMRERVAEFSPSIAKQAPGIYPLSNMTLEAENVTAITRY